MTCCLLTQRGPLFSSQEHTATCSHFHASATVILTQHRPVTHFPLVAWAFKLYPVACEGSACCAKRYLLVIALLLAECLKSERQDILHVEDMGVFTSTAVQTSLSCMNPLCFFQVSHLQYSESPTLAKSHHFIRRRVNVTCG